MRRTALFSLALIASLIATQAVCAETLTDDTVVQLSRAGLSSQTIVAKIEATPSQFDISTDALLWLKRQDVPDEVIAAMVTAASGGALGAASVQSDSADPLAPHAAGLYLLETTGARPAMQRLDPTVADDIKASGALGWILTYGLAPLKVTAVMAGPTARLKTDTRRPEFFFYFNQPGSGFYQHGLGWLRMPGPAPTPDLFALVRFQTVGGSRQLLTQRIHGALSGPGEVNDTHVAFRYAAVSPGVFKVTPQDVLDPGEYAFVYTPQSDGDDAQPHYFDFSVPG
ncbi:MAG TPA: hypothetical protein VN814_20165 [Caulobacteraceae bacterium]|nr:hypothetical protein [Caulobacteraceae bacterium]